MKNNFSLYFGTWILNSCATFDVEGVLFSGILKSLGRRNKVTYFNVLII